MIDRPDLAHSRRRFLATATRTAAVGAVLGATPSWISRPAAAQAQPPSAAEALRPPIRPRADWAHDPPRGAMEAEAPGDVRFLLVHHSASATEYRSDAVPGILRSFYEMHTSVEKGWPDVAYNFFVDRFGGIWEGRAGSLDAPIKGDATGGSQGFAQLCCLVGNFHEAPPTPEMLASTHRLLAWLAVRYGIDPTPGATTQFTSRGSNRWPAGTAVTARTISGHRDMSLTLCPGDHLYPRLDTEIPAAVAALVADAVATTTTTSTSTSTTTTSTTTTTITTAATTPASEPASDGGDAGGAAAPANTMAASPSASGNGDDGSGPVVAAAGGATALVLGLAAVLGLRNRQRPT